LVHPSLLIRSALAYDLSSSQLISAQLISAHLISSHLISSHLISSHLVSSIDTSSKHTLESQPPNVGMCLLTSCLHAYLSGIVRQTRSISFVCLIERVMLFVASPLKFNSAVSAASLQDARLQMVNAWQAAQTSVSICLVLL